MSTCPRCFEDTGCTCKEDDRIAALELVNQALGQNCDRLAAINGQLERKIMNLESEVEHQKQIVRSYREASR